MNADAAVVTHAVAAALGREVVATTRLGGGDVAASFAVDLEDGRRVFAKTHATAPPGFFTTEASSLAWLREPDAIRVPGVLAVGDHPPHLVLEWIEEGSAATATEASFGRAMAALHAAGSPTFGRTDRRTTGSLELPNDPCDTWAVFFASMRLFPLARLARDDKALPASAIADLESLAGRLDGIAPVEPPARLHGDLWGGNRLVDRGGASWLIDPAAHGGHREFDLAMMRLFGGFSDACFAAYNEVAPLADGWEERVPLHQLAPLVVHAIKFGGHYVRACTEALAGLR